MTAELALNAFVERAAQATHEVNKAYCEALGDTSQKPWDEAEAWQKESARQGVRAILLRPRDAASNAARESHENWCAVKTKEGWTYGPEKDPVAKTHPCLVSYDQLPAHQRVKDELFVAVVTGMQAKYFLAP